MEKNEELDDDVMRDFDANDVPSDSSGLWGTLFSGISNFFGYFFR